MIKRFGGTPNPDDASTAGDAPTTRDPSSNTEPFALASGQNHKENSPSHSAGPRLAPTAHEHGATSKNKTSRRSADGITDQAMLEQVYNRPHDKFVEVPASTLGADGEVAAVTLRKRSLRSKRRIFTISCTAFTVGLLMIVCTSPYSNEFMVPGPLSSNHAQILAGQGADRCAACHAAGGTTVGQWVANTLSLGKAKGLTQSELCMKCHDKSLNPDASLNPHNVPPNEMADITSKYEQVSFDAGMVFQPPVSDHNIACSACHREHHGSAADLTALTDRQCQTCHQSSFHSFATDHPEFTAYPQKRRSRISFDHSSHAAQHFPSKNSEFNCNQCHLDDDFQNVKKLASYEQACSTCHHQQILESGKDGLALIALPMLDTDAIESANLKIGSWPMAATGDFDGPVPPIMRVMLTADPAAAEILNRFGPAFDFADIDPTNSSDVKDAVELVWAIKRLLYDLSLDGPRAVRTRLESVMKLDVSDDELQKMVTNLDAPVFQNAVKRWLPNLTVEVTTHRFGSPKNLLSTNDRLDDIALEKSDRSWWPADEALLMRVASKDDVLAENPLKGLMNLPASAKEAPIATVRVPSKKTPSQPAQVAANPGRNEPPANAKDVAIRIKNAHADPLSDPELLAVNPLQAIESGSTGAVASSDLPKVNTPKPTETGLVNETPQSPKKVATAQTNVPVKPNKFVPIDRPPIVVPSGWFRNDTLFQISYRPSGHADACVQSWIELVTRASDADSRSETKQLFDKTISMTSIGLCRTCHTVDQLPDRSFAVNWKATYRDPSVRSFTRFAHGPHMIQANLQDCSHCHSLDMESRNAESFVSLDSNEIVSNFMPMVKSNCTSCHSANESKSGCTQCHNYHIGSRITGVK